MYYRMLGKLKEQSVAKLIELSEEVKYSFSTGSRLRGGRNIPNVLSKYHYSKWFQWKAEQRKRFKEIYPVWVTDLCVQVWFLKFDPVTGLLDEMVFAVNSPRAATFISTSLKDGQEIIIEGRTVVVNKGETITFKAATIHEIKESKQGQLWVCMMVRKEIEDLDDIVA